MKNFVSLTFAALALSACAGQPTQYMEPTVMEVKGLRIYNADSEHQTSFIKDHGSSERVCFSRGEDAVETGSSGLSGDLGFLNVSEDISNSSNRGAVVLGGRDPAVLISREIFYRICELTINLNLDREEALKLFREAMEVSAKLSMSSDKQSATQNNSNSSGDQKKDQAPAAPQGVD